MKLFLMVIWMAVAMALQMPCHGQSTNVATKTASVVWDAPAPGGAGIAGFNVVVLRGGISITNYQSTNVVAQTFVPLAGTGAGTLKLDPLMTGAATGSYRLWMASKGTDGALSEWVFVDLPFSAGAPNAPGWPRVEVVVTVKVSPN